LKRYSKEYFINLFISINCRKVSSELTTPRNKNFFDNKIKRDIGFSWSKNNLRSPKQINSSQHSFFDNFINSEEKKVNTNIKKEKKEKKKYIIYQKKFK
jgi:hypothetical protein